MTTRMKLARFLLAPFLCAVIFGTIALLVNQTAIAAETNSQPLIYFKARFIKVPESSIGFILQSSTAVSTNEITTTEIIPAEKLRPVLHGLYDNYQYLVYAELENVTPSGLPAQRNCDEPNYACETNCAIDVRPMLSADGFTLNLKATASKPEKMGAQANVWDGQTLAIIPPKSDGTNRLVVFVTVKLVDSAGSQIHSDEELFSREQKMKTAIPPQE